LNLNVTVIYWNACIGKQQALSLDVTCNFRLYLNIGRTSVNQSWKHRLFTSNYRCLHTGVPYNTVYGWNRPKMSMLNGLCLPI